MSSTQDVALSIDQLAHLIGKTAFLSSGVICGDGEKERLAVGQIGDLRCRGISDIGGRPVYSWSRPNIHLNSPPSHSQSSDPRPLVLAHALVEDRRQDQHRVRSVCGSAGRDRRMIRIGVVTSVVTSTDRPCLMLQTQS